MVRLFPLQGLICLLATLLVACNDGVFVDEDLPADDVKTSIDGDGGEAKFNISMKHLQSISIDRYDGMAQFKCYDRSGQEIPPDSPLADLHKIAYESIWLNYEIIIDGNAIKIKSIENCSTSDFTESIRLEYSYATRFIKVTIKAGQPMYLENCRYADDIEVVENAGTRSERKSFNNAGHIDQTLEVYPMIQAQSQAYGKVTPSETWVKGFKIIMPVLQYRGDGWVIETFKEEFWPGEKYRMSIPNLLDKVSVPVPPLTKAVITSEVTMTTARAHGVMTFRAPVSHKVHTVDFKCEAVYPKSYDIKIEYADD